MNKLFCDMKTDEEKAAFFLSGRGYETGVIAHSIQNDVAMAYHRCAEYKKELAALRAAGQKPISAYTCTVPDDCETLHWRGQILSMNELASVAQPAMGEEIMVNTPYDVFTLPLRPSGLSSGPRFVVHVPGPEQPTAVDGEMMERIAALLYEETTGEPWTVADVKHYRFERAYYRRLAHKVAALTSHRAGGE